MGRIDGLVYPIKYISSSRVFALGPSSYVHTSQVKVVLYRKFNEMSNQSKP